MGIRTEQEERIDHQMIELHREIAELMGGRMSAFDCLAFLRLSLDAFRRCKDEGPMDHE